MVPTRPHAHLSNRARGRAALGRRPIVRSTLENPFRIAWPSVSGNVQNVILSRLVVTLEKFHRRSKKSDQRDTLDTPALDQAPVVGINAVTRALESQLRAIRTRVISCNQTLAPSPVDIVFVCHADVDPASLVAHIPHLVAACNSPKNAPHPVMLVPLPEGSESAISQVLGLHRAAAVAIRRGSPTSETFPDILDSVPILSAPWLCPSDTQTPRLVPTHVKQLRTTAPRDMKAAREQRSKARAAAKSFSRPARRMSRITLTTEPRTIETA